ncbi:hypothetical protein GCM10028801_30800 [Nocardioides maradonensis]
MDRKRWLILAGTGAGAFAVLDGVCMSDGNDWETFSTVVRNLIPNNLPAEAAFVGGAFLTTAVFCGHILDRKKRAGR